MPQNLWPDFDVGKAPRSPKTVVEEAGSGLERKTNGLIQFYAMGLIIENNIVEAQFSLYAPFLRYHFPFMRIKFSIDSPYPVTIAADKMVELVANNENELLSSLAKVFGSPTTIETVQRLMSLSPQ